MVTLGAIGQAVLSATFISALYAIIAIGFTLIFGVGGILNFAHGAFITVGAFAAYLVTNSSGLVALPVWVGLVVGAAAGAATAAVTYLGIIRYVRKRPVTVLILTFVIGFFLIYSIRIIINSGIFTFIGIDNPLSIPVSPVIRDPAFGLGGSLLNDVFIFVTSWLFIGLLFYFVNYTRTGRAILAVSMSDKGAALVGIDAEKINLITWTLAGAFAGYAGVLLAGSLGNGSWLMSIQPPAPLILSFAIVILGGLGSIKGSVVGAYIIGFFEIFTINFVPNGSRLAGVSSLALLLVFLLVKPEGLFGREAAE
ncbi:branched-chain amino acid ABC transporter permease [Natronomonas marina]|jgi:branched-chain amino acid transport system permease protein|uniref:branched-chain amino acid ABC transporter permease n=1 Tax=Natronomonas marina TaxID=2961939 RepID=UPI0020C965FE|nr:branched-chain amino acid ABC transporter permease [Natronomonas marina]